MIAQRMPSPSCSVFVAAGAGPATLDPSYEVGCSCQAANGTHGNPTDDFRHQDPCLHNGILRRHCVPRTLHRPGEDDPGHCCGLQSP
jgi:hypothetical protein